MILRKAIRVEELIDMVREHGEDSDLFCVYGESSDEDDFTLDSACFLDDHPEVTDNDEEVFPYFVEKNGLVLWFRDELIQDVVCNAIIQKLNVSNAEVVDAIHHYLNTDCFLDF